MDVHEIESASFGEHRAWLVACGRDLEALDAVAESAVGVPNVDEALERARDMADQFESQAAPWRGIVRAFEQVPSDRQVVSSAAHR